MIRTLYVELTKKCNLRCAHCYNNTYTGSYVSKSACVAILDSARRSGVKDIVLTGGEPLLHRDIIEIIVHARNNGCQVGVLSNGTLINGSMASALAQSRVNCIQLSVDGSEPAHDRIRGKGSFSKLMSAVVALRANGLAPILRFTISSLNRDEYVNAVEVARSLGVSIRFGLVSPIGAAEENMTSVHPPTYFHIVESLHRLKKTYYPQIGLPNFAIENYLNGGPAISECVAGSRIGLVDVEGRFLPCPFLSSVDFGPHSHLVPMFSESALLEPQRIPLFRAVKNLADEEVDCFLHRTILGSDLYSLASFREWQTACRTYTA